MGSQVLVGVEVLVVGVGGHVVQVVAGAILVVGGQRRVHVVIEGVSGGDAVPPGEVGNPYRVFTFVRIIRRSVDMEDRL